MNQQNLGSYKSKGYCFYGVTILSLISQSESSIFVDFCLAFDFISAIILFITSGKFHPCRSYWMILKHFKKQEIAVPKHQENSW